MATGGSVRWASSWQRHLGATDVRDNSHLEWRPGLRFCVLHSSGSLWRSRREFCHDSYVVGSGGRDHLELGLEVDGSVGDCGYVARVGRRRLAHEVGCIIFVMISKSQADVRKAVIPVAGLGTRFLPATKSTPKEMLPVVDKPVIQYVVEEAVAAGLTDVLMVTGRNKRSLEDHFDRVDGLEQALLTRADAAKLALVREPSELADFHFVRQGELLGLGHAVLKGEHHVGGEPFAVLLGDDIIDDRYPVLPVMLEAFQHTLAPVIALMEVPDDSIHLYGCAAVETTSTAGVYRIVDLVEKPDPGTAPSSLAVIGRYVLTPDIFPVLQDTGPGRGGEIQLTDALKELSSGPGGVYGVVVDGARYDMGDKLSYMRAVVELASRRDDVGPDFKAWLRTFVAHMDG